MVYSLSFNKEFYAQIIENNENAPVKALLYKREVWEHGSRLRLIARTFAKNVSEAISLLDLFVESRI